MKDKALEMLAEAEATKMATKYVSVRGNYSGDRYGNGFRFRLNIVKPHHGISMGAYLNQSLMLNAFNNSIESIKTSFRVIRKPQLVAYE